MNKVPFENPVIPEVKAKNVDEVVDNSHIMWRDSGQLFTLLLLFQAEKQSHHETKQIDLSTGSLLFGGGRSEAIIIYKERNAFVKSSF